MSTESNIPSTEQPGLSIQADSSSPQSPSEVYDTRNTFRISEIPGFLQRQEFHTAFAYSLGLASHDVEICSFARDITSQDSRTSTAVFRKQPPFFMGRGNLKKVPQESSKYSVPGDSCVVELQTSRGPFSLVLDQNFFGFTPLSPIETEASIQTDCFVVHGFGGNAIGSFRDKGSHYTWIRDSLSHDIPELNVLTYGYHSSLDDKESVSDVHEWAQNFRTAMCRYRTRSNQPSLRPILFIVHSLGGWLFKEVGFTVRTFVLLGDLLTDKAIINLSKSQYFEDTLIVRCTLGALFFGVPSGGMDIKYLSAMATGSSIYTLQLLDREVGARMRQKQHEEFCEAFHWSNGRIIQFKEGKKTKLADGSYSLLVDANSSSSGRPGDGTSDFVFTIAADHKDMVKFSKMKPDHYRDVRHAIQKTFMSSAALVISQRLHPSKGIHPQCIASSYSEEKLHLKISANDDRLPSNSTYYRKRGNWTGDSTTSEDIGSELWGNSHRSFASKRFARSKSGRPFKWKIPHFTSRSYYDRSAALKQLRLVMVAENDRSFGIHGIGGIGKTQLALKYIEDYSSEYSHIFWLSADSKEKFDTTVRQLVLGLGLTEQVTLDTDQSFHLLKEWLESCEDWLVIIDNVEGNPKELLKNFLPSPMQGSIITTSQSPVIVERRIVRGGIRLMPLEEAEGAEFLLQNLGTEDPPEVNNFDEQMDLAKEISRELGGHPLALHTMSAYITETPQTLSTFLAAYRRDRSTYMSENFGNIMKDISFEYDKSLTTCFSLTLKPLHDSLDGDLLGILSVLDPDTISDDILKGYVDDVDKTDIPVLADNDSYNTAFLNLRRRGLVVNSAGKVSIHRLVQDTWLHASEKKNNISLFFDHAVKCLRERYPRQINGESMAQGFNTCLALTAHVFKLKHHYERLYIAPRRSMETKLPESRETFIELLADSGWYLYEKGEWQAAKSFQELAEGICQDTFGDKPHKLTAIVIKNLGVIHGSQNNYELELAYAMRTLSIREKCLPPNHPDMGNAYSNMGHSQVDKGDYDAAEKYYRLAKDVHEAAEVPSNDLLEGAYSCLGKNMLYRNRLDEAEHWIIKAIQQHDALPENFFVAETYFALGSLRMKQGRWKEAEREIRKSLEIRIRILRPKARLVGICLHHLAFILHHQKDNHAAIQKLRDCVAIFQVPAQTQPGLLQRSMSKLSSILKECGTEESIQEAHDLIQQIGKLDQNLNGISPEDEKGWNNIVQVAYRCM